jgi:voltage-gated potassium channel
VSNVRQGVRKISVLRVLRSAIKSWRFRWFMVLTVFLVVLILSIRTVEIGSNEPFRTLSKIIYWAVVTIATVGYGDITPKTPTGQLLTIFLIITGVVLVSFMTASIASILTTMRIREGMGLKKVDLSGHIVICGYNANIDGIISTISSIAKDSLPDVVLINMKQESDIVDLIERFPEVSIHYVHGDYTNEQVLMRASVQKASSAVILADSGIDGSAKPDDRTLLATLAIKSLSQEVKVCVELLNSASEAHLKRAGVDQIVISGEFSGFLLASAVMAPGIPQALKDMMDVDAGSEIQREKFPKDLVGVSFRDAVIGCMDRFGQILIGVITEKKSFSLETVISGEKGAIDDFIRRKFSEAGRSLEMESKGRFTVILNPGQNYIITEDDSAIVITPKRRAHS